MNTSFHPIEGGIASVAGIQACGISAGFRKNPHRLDCALIAADKPVVTVGVFTQNHFCAAPVTISRKHLANGQARALIINSGNANAATGDAGLATATGTCDLLATALGCEHDDVLVASTGVIGVPLELEKFESAIPQAIEALSSQGGTHAAQAIMTTDTVEKEYALEFSCAGVTYHVGGMAKGSGMIMPNMATMIAVLATDMPLDATMAHDALKAAVDCSFNKVTVDSDTSTNDSCYLFATGAAASCDSKPVAIDSPEHGLFMAALIEVCETLAKMIARDGEGSTKLIEVLVSGAASAQDADACARTIANSPLVKTAIAGHDANWGRIAAAAGRSGADFKQEDVNISIMGIPVCHKGLGIAFSEEDALARFENPEILLEIDLGAGMYETRIWTCDLTHDYISINADYRS